MCRFDAATGALACEFHELTDRQRELLTFFARGVLSGEMESVDGIIRRIDSPVTPVDVDVAVPKQLQSSSAIAWNRARYAFYVLVGVVATAFLADQA